MIISILTSKQSFSKKTGLKGRSALFNHRSFPVLLRSRPSALSRKLSFPMWSSLRLQRAVSIAASHLLPSSSYSSRIWTCNLIPGRLSVPCNPSSCGRGVEDLRSRFFCSSDSAAINRDGDGKTEILKLEEIESVLKKVKADDVRVIPVGHACSWADYMVFATGRSTWHVKNIAQAILYEAKEKQRGVKRMVLPSVEGQGGGKWIVIDSGSIMIHAFDEKARAYYNLEKHWLSEKSPPESSQELAKGMLKIRRRNNSKKRVPRVI